ncbi:MAG: hypothetical protein EXS06_00315 [Planctomycetaceae bacterium]|nr:hypothetical protein [Planctomycetaceae bacterium]
MPAAIVADRPSRTSPSRCDQSAGPHRSPKAPRRRFIDPTTCDRDYGLEEVEFMQAVECYKRASGRMFPTCSEILEVVRSLGYRRDIPA